MESPRHGRLSLTCRMPDGGTAPAIAYPALGARIRVGDRVMLNTTAVDLNLGTGGVHFVVAGQAASERPDRAPGHIIKMRYTPLQLPVLAVEEADSPWHRTMEAAESLNSAPVVCCELASQVPAVLAGCLHGAEKPRVALVHTDEAALPLAFSEAFATMRAGGLLRAIVTAGQAFGGDFEAVNVYSGLLAARCVAEADVVIVSPGPGTVGTATRFGFGGVAQGEALNAAHVLGGCPVAVLRLGMGDARLRHQGISHHTLTVLTRVSMGSLRAAWPAGAGEELDEKWRLLREAVGPRLEGVMVDGAAEALDAAEDGLPPWNTMGRSREDDPLFFEAAAAAGLLARRLWRENS